MTPALDLAAPLFRELENQGVALQSYALALARVLPSALIIPAFGLASLATPTRVVLGLVLALSVAPAISPVLSEPSVVAYALEFARGLPLALSASAVLWASSMTGALADELAGVRGPLVSIGTEPVTALGTLLSLAVAIGFLATGGPELLVRALTAAPQLFSLAGAARDLVSGVNLAVAVAAPLVVVSIVVEVILAIAGRVAFPLQVQIVLAPLRPFLVLGALALLLDRMVELFVLALR